jgi:glycosyltransferase involved in cell wall biosynthesis
MSSTELEAPTSPRALPGATVLQIVPSLVEDNTGRSTVDVALALLRSGARAIVAGTEGPLVGELQGFGGEWIGLAQASHNPLTTRANVRALDEFVSTQRVDVIHARGVNAGLSGAAVSARTGSWLVNSFAGTVGARTWHDKAYGRVLAQSARVIAHSGYVAAHVMERYKLERDRMVVIPRRVDTQTFDPAQINPARVATVRRTWKIRRGERVFLVPGRLDPAKGQLNVVDAVRMLVNGGLTNALFVFAGDDRRNPDYADELSRRAAAQGIGSMIRRVGVCRDMPAAYSAAEFVIVPATEPPTFGRAAAEALAMGRPVVATAVGALPEFVLAPPRVGDDERTGWLCAPDDPRDLARALAVAVATDGGTYRALATRAYRMAKELFAPSRVAAATLALYASLLQSTR